MAYVDRTWELLYRAIIGHDTQPASLRRPQTEDGSVQNMIAELRARFGTDKAAAAAAQVPRSTWGFWKAGVRRPKPGRMDTLRAFQRRSRVPADRARWLPSPESQIGLHLIFRVSNDERERKIIITGWRDTPRVIGMQRRIMNHFYAMDGSSAVDEIVDALGAGVNGDAHIVKMIDIRWFETRAEALEWNLQK
jgi:hypothetical protein